MRFEPNLIPADEPPHDESGDVQLPPELEAIAQQLADDAARLSRVYPASRGEVALPAAIAASGRVRRMGRRVALGIGATAVAAAIVLIVAVVDWPFGRSRGGKTLDATAALNNGAAARTDDEAGLLATAPGPRAGPMPDSNSTIGEGAPSSAAKGAEAWERTKDLSPVLLLREVTGPELEALFDLLEGQPAEATNISI